MASDERTNVNDGDGDGDNDGEERTELEKAIDEGWAALERGELAVARSIARQSLAADPDAPDALLLEAACLREEGETERAVAVLRRAAKADPEWCTPPLWLAELLAMEAETIGEALQQAALALDLAEEEDEFLNALALKAGLEVELGQLKEARSTLQDLPAPGVVLDDPTLALEIGDLLLAVGEPEEARERLRALADSQPDMADAWYTLGIAAEALGDDAGMRSAWKLAWRLDSADQAAALPGPAGSGLGDQELVNVAEQALQELPERARHLLRDIPIIVADLPAEGDVDGGLDPRALGLFSGTSFPETSNMGGQPGLTQILLFRRNLERTAADEDELREEIRTTLLHETGHFFGMDESDLEKVGLD